MLATLIILLAAFRANSKSSWGLFLFIPVSLLIFSFRQHSNMLFGYQINFAFVEMFGVLTLFLLYILGRNSHKNLVFLSALMSATATTYSVVSGLLVWPAGLLQLLVGPLEKPEKRVFIMLWSLVGLTEWTIYLRGWTPGRDCSSFIEWCYQKAQYQGNPGDRSVVSPLLHIFENPLADIDFFLSLLANSLLWPNHQATVAVLVVGLLLICLALVGLPLVKKNRKLGENSFWV